MTLHLGDPGPAYGNYELLSDRNFRAIERCEDVLCELEMVRIWIGYLRDNLELGHPGGQEVMELWQELRGSVENLKKTLQEGE